MRILSKTINAVVRSLEVIGEAAKKMPDSMKKKRVKARLSASI